jgi:hypothetical protein
VNGPQHFAGAWVIEHQGSGPALNIRHSEPHGEEGWTENVTPLKVGDLKVIPFDGEVVQNRGFTIEYESLSGKQYVTTVTWEDGVMRTRFGVR